MLEPANHGILNGSGDLAGSRWDRVIAYSEEAGGAMKVDGDLTVTMNRRTPLQLMADAQWSASAAGATPDAVATTHPTVVMPMFEHRFMPCEHSGVPPVAKRPETAG
jgi:hypothetical protein